MVLRGVLPAFFLLLVTVSGQAAETLQDGVSVQSNQSKLYKYWISGNYQQTSELVLLLTRFAGESSLFVSDRQDVSPTNYQWASSTSDQLLLYPSNATDISEYFIWVECQDFCRYALMASYLWEMEIIDGVPASAYLMKDRAIIFKLPIFNEPASDITFTIVAAADPNLRVDIRCFEGLRSTRREISCPPASLPATVKVSSPRQGDTYWFELVSHSDIFIDAIASFQESAVLLQSGKVVEAMLENFHYKLYRFQLDDETATVRVRLTVFSGYLMMTARSGKVPSVTEYDFQSAWESQNVMIITKDDRTLRGLSTGEYFLKVTNQGNAAHFTLSFTLETTPAILLLPGIIQYGFIQSSECDYYLLDIPQSNDDWNITLYLTAIRGRVQMMAALCVFSTDSQCVHEIQIATQVYKIESHIDGVENEIIDHKHEWCNGADRCRYVIQIKSMNSMHAEYQVAGMFDEDTRHALVAGEAVRVSQPAMRTRNFVFRVVDQDVAEVTFKFTIFSGEISFSATRNCSLSSWEYEKQTLSDPLNHTRVLSFRRGIDGPSLQGSFCLAAQYPSYYSEYSILAYQHTATLYDNTITLKSGYPQRDTLFNRTDRYMQVYSFAIRYTNQTAEAIKITVAAISGRFNVFVCNSMDGYNRTSMTFTYYWFLMGIVPYYLNNSLYIDPSDEYYKPNSGYQILVIANQWDELDSASYIISLKSGDDLTALQENTPYSEELLESESAYYKYPMRNDSDLKLTITLLSGETEVFISFSRGNAKPNRTSFDLYYVCSGTIAIQLFWEYQIQPSCKEWPCYAYIALSATRNARLTIKAQTNFGVGEPLVIGRSYSGEMGKGEFEYFSVVFEGGDPLEVMLQSVAGDSDLYVYEQRVDRNSDPKGWNYPSTNDYTNSSLTGGSIDSVVVSPSAAPPYVDGVAIGVYCRSPKCRFSLSAAQSTILLLEGSSHHISLSANQTRYFQFYNSEDEANIVIRVTAVKAETLRVFLSFNREGFPNETSHDWYFVPRLGKQMEIGKAEERFEGRSMKGFYMGMIMAESGSPTSFALAFLTSNRTAVQLLPGIPQIGQVLSGEASLFTFHNGKSMDLTISLTPYLGRCWIYVSLASLSIPPSQYSYLWSSLSYHSFSTVIISRLDPNFCLHCDYLIAVQGIDLEQVFSITVTSQEGVVMLMNGVPVQGFLDQGESKRYLIQVEIGLAVDVAVTSFAGDADLYVGEMKDVSPEYSTWNSSSSSRVDHIHIAPDERSPASSFLYICVFGSLNTSFSITYHTQDSYIHLVDGWPMMYSIAQDKNDRLFFDFHVRDGPVQCELRPIVRNFYPKVYVTHQLDGAQAVKPAPGIAELVYDQRADYENALGELMFQIPRNLAKGKLNIGVYSRKGDTIDLGVFSLSCVSISQSIVLRDGQSGFGLLSSESKFKRYSILINSPGILEVSVMPCSGKVTLEISANSTEGSDPEVTIATLADGRLFGAILRASGGYFVTVRMIGASEFAPGASFEVMAEVVGEKESRKKMQAGGDGILTWKQISSHRYRFHWSPPEYTTGSPLPSPSLVRYRLYYTYSLAYPLRTVCGIASGELNSLVSQPTNHPLAGQTTFVLFLPALQSVQVVLIAYIESDDREVAIPYTPVYIDIKPRPISVSWTIISVGIVLVIVAGVVACIVNRRYRETRKRLEFELTEQRKKYENTTDVEQAVKGFEKLDEEKIAT